MKNINPVATGQYVEKADHFFQAMRLLADDRAAYRTGIDLLAVHSAISLSDAITSGLTGKRSKHQDHLAAVTQLESLSRKHHITNRNGIGYFRWLLTEKSRIAYGGERLDDGLVLLSISRAERFHAWAYNYFKEIFHASAGA